METAYQVSTTQTHGNSMHQFIYKPTLFYKYLRDIFNSNNYLQYRHLKKRSKKNFTARYIAKLSSTP